MKRDKIGVESNALTIAPELQRNIENHVDALLKKEMIRPPEYRLGMIAAIKLRVLAYLHGHHVVLEIPYDKGTLSRCHYLNGCERGHVEFAKLKCDDAIDDLINTEVNHVPSTAQ